MTDKMTQQSHEDMSKETNKDGVAVRIRGNHIHIWKAIFCIIGVLGMLMFIYPVFRGCHVNIGTLLGTGVFALLTLYGIFRGKIDKAVRNFWNKKAGKICLSIALVFVALALALIMVITYHMVYAAHVKPRQDATVVVLGCAVRGGGPSLMLRERLIAAQDYLEENPEAVCVVSGGQGADESISEAKCMYEYLTEHGIASERIYMEDKSTSTRENIKFSAEIIRQNGLPDKMNIVTNEFHEYRAKRIADKQGIETGSISGSTAWWLLPTYYVREMAGILYEWISG